MKVPAYDELTSLANGAIAALEAHRKDLVVLVVVGTPRPSSDGAAEQLVQFSCQSNMSQANVLRTLEICLQATRAA